MDTLDKYLSREFCIYFVIIWASLATLFMSIDFFTRYWDLEMTLGKIFQLYAFQIPGVLQQFLPVACLMATMMILSSMSRQNEILALYLGGVSLWRLVSTFLAIVATLSTLCFLIFDSWVPYFEKRRVLLKQGMDPSADHLLLFGNERFWYRSAGVIYNVGRYLPDRNVLEDLNIYLMDPEFHVRERIQAKTARFINNDWSLEDGFSVQFPDTRFPVSTTFKGRVGVIPEKPADFRTLRLEESMMRLKDLRKYIERNRNYGFDTTRSEVGYHERMALIFAPLIFVLFAVALVTQAVKHQSSARSIGLCFGIVFVYLLVFRVFLSIGKGGHIPPVVAGWSSNLVFLMGAISLIAWKR